MFDLILVAGISCLILGVVAWRWVLGLYIIVVWDVIRDPLRKLFGDNILLLAAFGGALWLCCMLGCLAEQLRHRRLKDLQLPPPLRAMAVLLGVYLSAGLTAGVLNSVPGLIMGFGFASTVMPVMGFVVGRVLGQRTDSMLDLLAFSCILNAILIASVFLDLAGIRTPIIGGIMMEWYRMREGYSIPLPSGLFRSPDVLGLHVVYVLAFSVILFLVAQDRRVRRLWLATGFWSAIILILAARRKMIGFIVVFLLWLGISLFRRDSFSGFAAWQRLNAKRRIALAALMILVLLLMVHYTKPQLAFAFTTFTDFPDRIYGSVSASLTTIQQSGYWGKGLGVVTQGRDHIDLSVKAGWQEDGLSRCFQEAGIIGAGSALLSILIFLLGSIRRSQALLVGPRQICLNAGSLSLVVANLACGAISHLHLSGDPTSLGFLGLFAGYVWSPSKDQGRTID